MAAAGSAGSAAGQASPPAAAATSIAPTRLTSSSTDSATNSRTPIVVRPEERPEGMLGWLQMAGAVIFLWLMGSALYLCIAVALYIVIGFMLGHRVFPAALLAVWVIQALWPVKHLHQDPVGMKRSWLFREMARYFDMTLVMETALDTSKYFMLAQFPHGTIPIGPVLSAYFVHDVVPGTYDFLVPCRGYYSNSSCRCCVHPTTHIL